jgi:hypothetical protein
LSEDIRKPFCKGKALSGDFELGKNTTVWVFLLASNFKCYIGPLLTYSVFGQNPIYFGTKCMYHKQFVYFWACVYEPVYIINSKTFEHKVLYSFYRFFWPRKLATSRQGIVRARELLSGHPPHHSHPLAWSRLALSSLASLDLCPVELWMREVATAQGSDLGTAGACCVASVCRQILKNASDREFSLEEARRLHVFEAWHEANNCFFVLSSNYLPKQKAAFMGRNIHFLQHLPLLEPLHTACFLTVHLCNSGLDFQPVEIQGLLLWNAKSPSAPPRPPDPRQYPNQRQSPRTAPARFQIPKDFPSLYSKNPEICLWD